MDKEFVRLPLPRPMADEEKIALPKEWFKNFDERGILARFLLYKPYFGECYRLLYPVFFESNKFQGVVATLLANSLQINRGFTYPGDIDILVIPYDDINLIFQEMLVIEAKVVRASYINQGKSPNQFGFSQAQALYDRGFPYVAVAHFITSDNSPSYQWRKFLSARIGKNDIVEDLKEVYVDDLPMLLMERTLRRLLHNRKNENIGLLSSYIKNIGDNCKEKGMFIPDGIPCKRNIRVNRQTINDIVNFYRDNYNLFFNIPRYPPKKNR